MTATQSPILVLVPQLPGDLVTLPARTRDLDKQRDAATEKALAPDVVADLRESVDKALRRLAAHPDTPLRAVLYDIGRHMYVAGRMDQAADEATGRAQADALADAALAQVVDLVAARQERTGA